MSRRGPGGRGKALLDAVAKADGKPVRVVPPGVSDTERECWRAAARSLAERGLVRAVYLRRPNARGRWVRYLHIVSIDSAEYGNVRPNNAPPWVAMPPLTVDSLVTGLHAPMIARLTGKPCTQKQAARIIDEYRRAAYTYASA